MLPVSPRQRAGPYLSEDRFRGGYLERAAHLRAADGFIL